MMAIGQPTVFTVSPCLCKNGIVNREGKSIIHMLLQHHQIPADSLQLSGFRIRFHLHRFQSDFILIIARIVSVFMQSAETKQLLPC